MNTLNPKSDAFLAPWARSKEPGYKLGGNKFDLTRWDDAYFKRLKDFVAEASKRDIVVELTFFCTFFYNVEQEAWAVSPMNANNNINGIGNVPASKAYDLSNEGLTRVQKELIRKLMTELQHADNLYFEIINEGYHWLGPVPPDWQTEMLHTADQVRSELGSHQLLAVNIAQGRKSIKDLDPAVSILNFHYASPPYAVEDNMELSRPIAFDEDGFDAPARDWTYRENAWEFLMAGGAIYDNLDYSFAVGYENGTAVQEKAPGWGNATFRKQLRIMKEFIEGFDFPAMMPSTKVLAGGVAKTAEVTQEGTARGLALENPGKEYAVYITQQPVSKKIYLDVKPGIYSVLWLDPATGVYSSGGTVERSVDFLEIALPQYKEDIALALRRIY